MTDIKIAFNAFRSGLGPNGGSRTILKSAEVLREIGYKVDVIASVDNFNWFDHIAPVTYFSNDIDILINVAAVDYNITARSKAPIKAAWWRAHEDWSNSDEYLKACYLDQNVINIVNSNGLKNLLAMYGADSDVIYQGVDFDWWENRALRKDGVIRIGCLYTKQPRKRWQDFVKLHALLGDDGYEYISIGSAEPPDNFLKRSWVNVDHDELCTAYSSCDIWFAPTESEGLHNVPIEANLCRCLVVCADEPLNGMIYDYAFNENTAMVYDRKDINHAAELIKNPNWKLVVRMQKYIKENIGSRETNMKKLVELLENNI